MLVYGAQFHCPVLLLVPEGAFAVKGKREKNNGKFSLSNYYGLLQVCIEARLAYGVTL